MDLCRHSQDQNVWRSPIGVDIYHSRSLGRHYNRKCHFSSPWSNLRTNYTEYKYDRFTYHTDPHMTITHFTFLAGYHQWNKSHIWMSGTTWQVAHLSGSAITLPSTCYMTSNLCLLPPRDTRKVSSSLLST